MRSWVVAIGALAFFCGRPSLAGATTIGYQAINLVDVQPGEDLWQYQYLVSDRSFSNNQGFSVYFDVPRYTKLQSPPPPVNPAWDVISIQPDPTIPSSGFYDAAALVNGASLANRFTVTFVWLGGPGTAPGSQPFTVNQFGPTGAISFIETGATIPLGQQVPVPEPATWILLGTGIVAARSLRRRSRVER